MMSGGPEIGGRSSLKCFSVGDFHRGSTPPRRKSWHPPRRRLIRVSHSLTHSLTLIHSYALSALFTFLFLFYTRYLRIPTYLRKRRKPVPLPSFLTLKYFIVKVLSVLFTALQCHLSSTFCKAHGGFQSSPFAAVFRVPHFHGPFVTVRAVTFPMDRGAAKTQPTRARGTRNGGPGRFHKIDSGPFYSSTSTVVPRLLDSCLAGSVAESRSWKASFERSPLRCSPLVAVRCFSRSRSPFRIAT